MVLTGTFQSAITGVHVRITSEGIENYSNRVDLDFAGSNPVVQARFSYIETLPGVLKTFKIDGPYGDGVTGESSERAYLYMSSNGETNLNATAKLLLRAGGAAIFEATRDIGLGARKIGFHAATPIAKPILNAAATTTAETQALVNQIRQGLINYGLFQ